ncbi:MAG: hypothetical protein GXZ11_05245 [Tissierellia bacterium]|nr:hypothetical protein [Tissierellia bacterium]
MNKNTLNSVGKAILFIIIYIASKIGASTIGNALVPLLNIASDAHYVQISLFTELLPVAVILLFSKYVLKIKFEDLWLKRTGGRKYILGYIVGTILFCSYMAVALTTKNLAFKGRGELSIINTLLFLPAFAIQSFEEELLSRGLLQRVIKDKFGIVPSIILPSAIFRDYIY